MTARGATIVASLFVLGLLASAGCRRAAPIDCNDVPTTADGCRERCHDRGAEMAFFRFDSSAYRCDAICECTDGAP